MTASSKVGRQTLDRLADALSDDILNMTDDEILAEFKETGSDPDRHATEMRAIFEKAVIAANKGRLAAAKEGAKIHRSASVERAPVDIAEARKRFHAIRAAQTGSRPLTLAARKESELSDGDILGIMEDLRELGVLGSEDDSSGTT